jgi:hypothetical protein
MKDVITSNSRRMDSGSEFTNDMSRNALIRMILEHIMELAIVIN